MKSIKHLFLILVALITTVLYLSCSVDYPDSKSQTVDWGNADFSVYLAIGNSLTAGVQNSGATVAGWKQSYQEVSYPAQIARQAGIITFTQPLLANNGLGYVKLDSFNRVTGKPSISTVNPSTSTPSVARPYHNMGVPGALLIEAPTAYDSASSSAARGGQPGNKLFNLVHQGQGTWLSLADSLNPTFISFWLGNNEVLGAATKGSGTAVATPAQFAQAFRYMIGNLKALTPAPGMVTANIFDVTSIPFVTELKLADYDSLHNLNASFPQTPTEFAETDIQYLLLSAGSAFQAGYGIPTALGGLGPLPGNFTLTANEVTSLGLTVQAYNDSIDFIARQYGVPVVNVNQVLHNIAAVSGKAGTGYNIGSGIKVKTDFITGGIFSLDGVHPNTLGYAMITNEFIKTINEFYHSTIPVLNLNQYMEN